MTLDQITPRHRRVRSVRLLPHGDSANLRLRLMSAGVLPEDVPRSREAEAKAYTFYAITSRGITLFAKGSLTGDNWTWLWEEPGWGKPATFRITQVMLSPTSYTIKVDYSVAVGPWTVIEDGRATKVK